MKTSLETRLGMFVALTVVAAAIVLELAGGTDLFRPGKRLHALFNTVMELKAGDPVKLSGVQIGKVEKIGIETVQEEQRRVTKVKVTMKIRRDAAVPTDSRATIRFAGLLGQNFIGINVGSATTTFEDGATIDILEQTDLGTLMTKLDEVASGIQNVAKSFSGESIQNILGPFTDFMKANQTKLTATIANMQIISQDITEGKGTVGKLIKDDSLHKAALDTVKTLNDTGAEVQKSLTDVKGMMDDAKKLMANANAAATNVNSLFDEAKLAIKDARSALTNAHTAIADGRTIIADINAGKGNLGLLIKQDALYKDGSASLTNLREILEKINKGYGTAGKFVNDESLFKNARMTLQKLDKATEGLEDQGPLSVLGMVVGRLF
ncbi:MAG: MCE family protein [Verrucomicrobia bacterium]|nr:MCE family protein [Verrucomicrobiota bacterium]